MLLPHWEVLLHVWTNWLRRCGMLLESTAALLVLLRCWLVQALSRKEESQELLLE